MENVTLAQLVGQGIKLTPMMEQYWSVKQQYPGELLFFRMGDFYEMFFEDAREVARLLNISLTVRGKLGDTPIPMAGIPHHAAAAYLDRLAQLGLKVVICEQLENPKEVKGIVKRGVTQIVSPAVPYDLDRASGEENRYIAAATRDQSGYLLCLLDFTTGDFFGLTLRTPEELAQKLLLYRPKEFLSTLGQWESEAQVEDAIAALELLRTHLSSEWFEVKHSELYLEKLVPGFKRDGILQQRPAVFSPLGALSWYIFSTQGLDKLQHVRPFRLIAGDEGLKVSWSTLRGLEIFPRNPSEWKNSLIGFMDRTRSALGARHLRHFFQTPLKDKGLILKRQELLAQLTQGPELLERWRGELTEIRDLDRIMAKITTRKATGSDLLNLAKTLRSYLALEAELPAELRRYFPALEARDSAALGTLAQELAASISEELGASADKGNLIKSGVHPERDRLATLALSAGDELLALELRYREETGISSLKVRSNNLAGFFVEVSNSHLGKVPKRFQRKQTLTNGERFVTDELSALETEVTSAQEKLSRVERRLFEELVEKVQQLRGPVLEVAKRLAQMDVYQSLAWVSLQEGFVRPQLVDSQALAITGAWHPLIRANLQERFVTHNIHLDGEVPFALITGPNMAGKTTVMREVAIIQYLAQLGAFVPASDATLGVCDYLFSRLGASDDIIRGQSTFMVEMSETAEILRHATDRSLIILDEIGRGTSTYDGLSIAWALVEFFAKDLKALTLFATHYHELIELADELPTAKNLTVRTEQHKGKVQFLYELIESGATQSFGIHVAELAGLPRSVLRRARTILQKLEAPDQAHDPAQLSLFAPPAHPEAPGEDQRLAQRLRDLDVLNMTPLEALNTLHAMRSASLAVTPN